MTAISPHFRSVFLATALMCVISLALGCATFESTGIEKPVDDLAIMKAIRAKIAADPELARLHIRVTSRQGEVALSGTAPSREIETRLIKLALSVQGVRSVKDDLTILKKK